MRFLHKISKIKIIFANENNQNCQIQPLTYEEDTGYLHNTMTKSYRSMTAYFNT